MTTSGSEFYKDELEPEQIETLLKQGSISANEVVEGLWHGQVLVRTNAARGARYVEDLPEPGEAMLRIVSKDADAGVRSAIVTAVSYGLGSHAVALPLLFDAVLDGGEGIRDTALSGLERRLLQGKAEVLPWFVAALADVRSGVAAAASQLMVKAGGEAAIPPLIPLLGSDDPRPRRAAYDILDQLKRAAVSLLIDALRDPRARELAARLLGGIGETDPSDRMKLEALATDAEASGDTKLFSVATKVLGEMGRPRDVARVAPADISIRRFFDRALDDDEIAAAAAVDEVLHALRDGRAFVRQNAARWLGKADAVTGQSTVGDKVVGKLGPIMRDPDAGVRGIVARTLGLIGGDDAIRTLVLGMSDPDGAVREAAVSALHGLGPAALGTVLEAVHAADPPVVARTFDGLRQVVARFGAAATQSLADALRGDRDLTPLAREVACLALGDIGPGAEDAVPALLATLKDRNEDVRAAGASALGFIGVDDDIVLADLARMLADSVPNVRRQAALAAARINGRPLDDRSSSDARVTPISGFEDEVLSRDALRPGAAKAGLESLIASLRDGRELVRQNAARAIGVLADEGVKDLAAAAKPLGMLLRDGDVDVRKAAIGALADLGKDAVGAAWALTGALVDPDDDVREAVITTLVALHPECEPFLVEALRSDTASAKKGIFVVWYRLAGAGVPALATALFDPSGLIRLNAARALELLAKHGAANAIGDLEARLADPVGQVGAAAQSAIDAIQGGKPLPVVVLEPDPIDVPGFSEGLVADELLAARADVATPERLARQMRDGRAAVRANAASMLANYPASDALSLALMGLAVLTRDEAAEVRVRSLTALGRLLADERAPIELYGEVLVVGLGDRTPNVRKAASAALEAQGERAFPALALGLGDSDERALFELTQLFVKLGEPALNALPDALSPLTPELHFGALTVLHAFGREALASVRPLVEPLAGTSESPDVRAAAVVLLDKIDGKDLIPVAIDPSPLPLPQFADVLMSRDSLAEAASELRFDLLAHAMTDGRDLVRANATTGMEVLGSAHELAWPYLVRALKDPTIEVRMRAAEALAVLPPRRDVAFELVRRLDDPSPRVIKAAEAALHAYGEFAIDAFMYALDDRPELVGRSILPMLAGLGERAVDKLVLAQRYDSPFVRLNALIGIRLLDKELGKRARLAVALARKDDEREVRLEALRTLEWIDGVEHIFVREPRTLPTEDFASGPVDDVQLTAAARGYDAGVLAELLVDGRRAVRENAATAHGLLDRYHPWLGILLKDSVGAVQVAAAMSLAQLGDKSLPSARALIGALLEEEPDVRRYAKEALLTLGTAALPTLIEGLWVPGDIARKTVVPFIEMLGKDATPAIIEALDHPSQLVVLNALQVLGRLYTKDPKGTVVAIPRVTALVKNPLPAIIGAAQKCLFRLEGRTPAEFQKDPVPMPIIGFDKGPLSVDTLRAEAPALDIAWMISAFSDGRPIVRENAARASGFMPNTLKDLLIPLTIALKDGIPEVQVAAADAFATLQSEAPTAVPALTFALRNATERVKRACMVALDAYGPERVAAELVKHLVGREEWMLATIGKVTARMSEVMVPALANFAKLPDESLIARENAVRVLGDLGQKARAAEPLLLTLLSEMEGMLAFKAAFALGCVARPSKELIEAMQARLSVDPRPSLHLEIRSAVKIIKRRMPVGAA